MPAKPAVDEQMTEGTVDPTAHKRPSGSTEAFFRTDGPHAGPVLVVYHIQKTAGTSLRRVVRANLPPSEVEIGADLQKLRYRPDELLAWHREWYRSLADERRAGLCCVMSHSAGYLLPALDRPTEALVLVREPLDRILSFYYYKRRRTGEPSWSKRTEDFFTLEQVYELGERGRAQLPRPARLESWDQFFNWQSRSLLSVFHDVSALPYSDGPTPDAELWRERLRELVENVFYAGVQDRFAEYMQLLSRRLGWKPSVPTSKVNERRPPASELSPALRERIVAYNWLDVELHELCRRVQERRESEEQSRW
jgi:hypothetical protein